MIRRERVKPAAGVPFFIELEKLGVRRASQYHPAGYEFYYEGAMHEGDQRKPVQSYLDPEAHEAIERAGARVGDLIRILKGKDGSYVVKIVSDAEQMPEPPREIRRLGPPAPPNGNGSYGSGNGHASGPANPPAPPPHPGQSRPMEDLLTRCFECAGRAIWRAHDTLQAEGRQMDDPIWEDVRAAGISLFIDRTRNGATQ